MIMAKKKVARAKAPAVAKKTPQTKAAVRKTGGGFAAPDQPPLVGMEDTNERIGVLDQVCQEVLAIKEQRKSLKEDLDEKLQLIEEHLDANGLDCYIVAGNKFYVEPGTPHVKVSKVQQRG